MDDEMEMNERIAMTLDDWIRQSPLPRIEARAVVFGFAGGDFAFPVNRKT